VGDLLWKDHLGDWRDAVSVLNDLAWNLSWREHDGRWYLRSGDQTLFVGETEGEFKAFVCGMALSLAVLPDSILDQIRRIAKE